MMKFIPLFLFVFAVIAVSNNILTEFGDRINKGEVVNDEITEASGLISSIQNPGVLWTHNDSGGKNRIFAIGQNGENIGEFYIDGAENRDWEDIALGLDPSNGKHYIFLGDIGDNAAINQVKTIYRIAEPIIQEGQSEIVDTIYDVNMIKFSYPDGARDAETLIYDPLTDNILIIGKRDSEIRLYRISYPYSFTETFEAELVELLSFPFDPEENKPNNYITGGDVSIDGREIILKTYTNIYYWHRDTTQSIGEVLSNQEPILLPFERSVDEAQGEAICWYSDNERGYFTLSEEKVVVSGVEFNFPAQLYYYPRITPVSTKDINFRKKFILNDNFPNPFNPSTTINYEIPAPDFVELTVYDITGKKISVLVNEFQSAG
ncbi:MAG: hypothetical protein R3250_06500, partial [Melioribacteraceae bacterium]|nr:hypothetical protein [Melioribacteraceae bacterium]